VVVGDRAVDRVGPLPVGGSLLLSPTEVLVTANSFPDGSVITVLRLMWSSAMRVPERAVSSGPQVASDAPSVWVAKSIFSSFWFDHITPILPLSATTAEMSSGSRFVSATGRT
jgi:hypothetical protein